MPTSSRIEWTHTTWNPVTGCTKVSAGCKHCYAEAMALRLKAMAVREYGNGFRLTLQESRLSVPFTWTKPRLVFVNSMSDLFHEDVPVDYIRRVFGVMEECHRHTFQVLTKRAARLRRLAPQLLWPSNVWIGVTVEDQSAVHRIDDLRAVPAAVRFLSLEPLLGSLRLDLSGIHWAIVGGESGPGARAMDPAWVDDILTQCRAKGVPFFFKQWGGVRKSRTGRLLRGRTYDEMPHPPFEEDGTTCGERSLFSSYESGR